MAQKTDPFVQLNWGWDDGENGWGSGMNENLIVSAFFHNRRLNDILADGSMLPPSPVDGSAYFVNSDKNVYIRAEGQWYNTLPPVGMTFVKKTDESVVKFNGTTLVADSRPISEVTGLQAALDAKVDDSQVGAINGVAPLGADGKVPTINLPLSDSYLGTWNATTNTPTIVSSTGTQGQYYEVTVGGSTTIDGISSWTIGDKIKFNGTVWQKIPNTSAVSSVNGQTGAVVLTNTDVGAAATSHTHSNATTSVSGFFSNVDKTKLDGISTGATANSSDATLLNRANHTGTQAASTISDLTETVQDIVGAQIVAGANVTAVYNDGAGTVTISATSSGGASSALGLSDVPDSYSGQGLKFWRNNATENAVEWVSLGTAAFNNTGDFANSSHTHSNSTTSVPGFMSNTDKTKLDGIASGATVNSPDSTLLNRANHTGDQAQSTITNLVIDLAAKAPLVDPTFTGTVALPSTTSIGTVSSTEIGYLDGVTSSLQTQLNNKQPLATVLTNTTASFTTALESKLNGIASGAEVNVNADWNAVSGDAQILNKPSFAAIATSGSASDLVAGTVADARLPSTMSGKTFTDLTLGTDSGQRILYISGGNSSTVDGSAVYFRQGGGVTSAIGNYSAIVGGGFDNRPLFYSFLDLLFGGVTPRVSFLANGNVLIGTTSDSGYKLDVNGTARIAGVLTADGSGLTNLNASNLSSGTVPSTRLPTSSTSAAGIVQLGDGSTASSSKAAAEAWVYGIDNSLSSLDNFVNTALVEKQKPSQFTQVVNHSSAGGLTINLSNGMDIQINVSANITSISFTNPPSTSEAWSATLEFVTSGTRTIVWPSGSRYSGGVTPALTTNGTDVFVVRKRGTDNYMVFTSGKGMA